MQFKLPDLGEGLQEAEVVEWLVKEGDTVEVDQLVVLVETAKAIVEIPSPISARITKLCANVGDMVKINEELIAFQSSEELGVNSNPNRLKDRQKSVSVVGELKTCDEPYIEDTFRIGSAIADSKLKTPKGKAIITPPSIIAFAKKLGVEGALNSNAYRDLNHTDLMRLFVKKNNVDKKNENLTQIVNGECSENRLIRLSGAKKIMAQTMIKSCQQVPAVTLFDDADISQWGKQENITLRLLSAIIAACVEVPLLNAWFDEENLTVQMFNDINIGVAVNMKDGLFVPVIRKAQNLTSDQLQKNLASLIEQVRSKKISPQKLLGATISLSNFGTLSGRYATPIVVPPQVAIIGVGKIRDEAIVELGKIKVARILPVSLTFDHRAASGADASAFLESFIKGVQKKSTES